MRRRRRMMPALGKMAILGLGVGAYMMYNKNNKSQNTAANNGNTDTSNTNESSNNL